MSTPSQHAFSEKVVLITDGVNPIGRAIAMQLGLYGAYVIVGNPDPSAGEARAIDELKSLGTLAQGINADASKVEGAKHLIGEVENIYGRLDLLVNCLNYRSDSTFDTTDEVDFQKTIDTNLKSTFFVTQKALRLMNPRPKPKIVNVIPSCDPDAKKTDVVFMAVNSGIEGFTKSLAGTLPEKFRVNAVAVKSKGRANSIGDLDEELFRRSVGIEPDDVARTVLFLLSSEANGINGQVLKVE